MKKKDVNRKKKYLKSTYIFTSRDFVSCGFLEIKY